MERYRIGDFARELGVTPDFLKYCERKGIITPQVEVNGYRYYGFTQAARLLEYIKFKNLGYTAEEIRDVLYESSFAQAVETLRDKAGEIRKRMRFEEAVLDYCDEVAQIAGRFGDEPVWQVRFCEDFYFLPHSVEHHFIGEASIRERVREWNAYFPVVQSVYRIISENGQIRTQRGKNVWGFGVEARVAQRLGLGVDEPVQLVRPGRSIEVFAAQRLDGSEVHAIQTVHEVARCNGFTLRGDAYSKVLIKLNEDGTRQEYAVLTAPIE